MSNLKEQCDTLLRYVEQGADTIEQEGFGLNFDPALDSELQVDEESGVMSASILGLALVGKADLETALAIAEEIDAARINGRDDIIRGAGGASWVEKAKSVTENFLGLDSCVLFAAQGSIIGISWRSVDVKMFKEYVEAGHVCVIATLMHMKHYS